MTSSSWRPIRCIALATFVVAPMSCRCVRSDPSTAKQDDAENQSSTGDPDGGMPPWAKDPPGGPVPARPPTKVKVSPDDPVHGSFTLADATQDLGGTGRLVATIETDLGNLSCFLFADKAPITVANFVGLARGNRPWKDPKGKWVKKPAYDGTTFHRVVKGFVIQGGDPKGDGKGDPGYVIPDEIWENGRHDRPGLLCMANRGADTNGAQFLITDAVAHELNRGYTIFGDCTPIDVVHKLGSVEVVGEQPKTPLNIKSVKIGREWN